MKKKRTGLIVTLALLLPATAIASCIGGIVLFAVGSSETAVETGPASADAQPTTESITTTGRDGRFEFTVVNVERGVDPPDEFWSEPPQGEYVAVTLQVENIGDEARDFDSSDQRLYDSDDREHEAAQGLGEWQYETINPGNATEIVIHYDVDPDSELAKMRLHDSYLSGGVEVDLPE